MKDFINYTDKETSLSQVKRPFCDQRMAYADKQSNDNKKLSFEVEKYKRMCLAVVKENGELKRKFNQIKDLVK